MEEIKTWLKRTNEANEVLKIIPMREDAIRVFVLMPAYELGGKSLGCILFDPDDYWIYDGDDLTIEEQEQVAAFIEKKVLGKV